MKLLSMIAALLPETPVYAHCDVPCGIYDPKAAQVAAATVLKMVEKIINPPAMDPKNQESIRNFHNSMTRYVIVKEEQARTCKQELLILWTDYFKPEHLSQFPGLHEKFWNAAKLCSKNKQEVNMEAAENLVKAVDEIADMFHRSKAAVPNTPKS